jgi:hypothetical protein
MGTRFVSCSALLGLGALVVACGGPAGAPTSPSAATAGSTAAGADGSTLKTSAPELRAPASGVTAIATPELIAEPVTGRFWSVAVRTLRFQLSEAEDFGAISDEGLASTESVGPITYRVQKAQRGGTRVYWRARAELNASAGPWSAARNFVVSGSAPTGGGGGNRTANPAPGQRLPLPNMEGQIRQWTNERPDLFPSQQCPLGVKYVNNPWQDYIVDRLRQVDTRWGYNAKPTRTASDNGGRPVVAAGDEILYNWGSTPDEGNTNEVYAVDMLTAHCGSPVLGWRVFTGEEPVRWTGAGRF